MTSSLAWMLASPNAMLVHLRREGNKLFDKPLPQLESDLPKLRTRFAGSILTCTPVLDLLIRYKGPKTLSELGTTGMIEHIRKDSTTLVDDIFVALKAQTVTASGTDVVEVVIPQLTANN
uniref:hypothetical protein n=1 Tax=Corynebacterium ulcerans TaxID=65058 RepID=UPI001F3424A8|nr:hypothetical protein [Corynebacterium ulcerans]